eukprot:262770-Hanusia_phi.AAC.2
MQSDYPWPESPAKIVKDEGEGESEDKSYSRGDRAIMKKRRSRNKSRRSERAEERRRRRTKRGEGEGFGVRDGSQTPEWGIRPRWRETTYAARRSW